jgi:hypothetical protein
MTEGGNGNGGPKKVLAYATAYTLLSLALGLGITFTFGADKRPVAMFVYVFHALFYSACIGGLLASMFHASEEH